MTGVMLDAEEALSVADAAELSPIQYDRIRASLAERLGVRVSALDQEVQQLRSANGNGASPDPAQGGAFALGDPEPWPSPVDGAELLDELVATFTQFLALPDHASAALALWTVHAHAHDAAEVSPILAVTSPVMRCGKTTTLELLGALVPRPLPAANVTAAALFRAVEAFLPTLLIDEADTFLRGSDELRGVLNSGHRCRSAVVVRTVGDDHEPRTFRTWGPKAIALNGKLQATLADRAIEVRMRRRLPDEQVERLRLDRLDELEDLRRRAWRWANDNAETLRTADPSVPPKLHDRAGDNWRPLLAVAALAGGPWPAHARAAAIAMTGAGDDEAEPAGTLLLADLAALFAERGDEHLASAEVVRHLVALEDRPWPEWRHDKPLTVRQLARLLRPFGIGPVAVWIPDHTLDAGGRTLRGYRREDLEEALARYAPPADVQEPQEPRGDAEKSTSEIRKASEALADGETAETPVETRGLAVLANGPWGEEPAEIAALRADAYAGPLEEPLAQPEEEPLLEPLEGGDF